MQRRKKKLVYREVQFRVVFIALCVATLVLLINFHMTFFALWSASAKVVRGMDATLAVEEVRSFVLGRFFITIGLAIPLAAAVGIIYSFKFAGPLYRFRKYFTELKLGRWDSACALRPGDDLQDLCAEVNAGLDIFRDLLRENDAILNDVSRLLSQDDKDRWRVSDEDVRRLKTRIDAALEVYKQRFPSPAKPAPSASKELGKALALQG